MLKSIDHIVITTRDLDLLGKALALAQRFHGKPDARTGVLIRNAADEHKDTPFDQWRIGLHHFCFRLRARDDVGEVHAVGAGGGALVEEDGDAEFLPHASAEVARDGVEPRGKSGVRLEGVARGLPDCALFV